MIEHNHLSTVVKPPGECPRCDLTRDHIAVRGSNVEAWLKAERDEWDVNSAVWNALDDVLDTYRLCSDTGAPLPTDADEMP